MKAIISSTYDDKYLFFLPIITWCWNKLGVDVICFMPEFASRSDFHIYEQWLGRSTLVHNTCKNVRFEYFICPDHKQATYAQCSRLYAAALSDLTDDEILITSDVDMAVFSVPPFEKDLFHIWGADLVPTEQYPICYISADAKTWRCYLCYPRDSYQECLDRKLGLIECDNFRGNYWAKDQEEIYKALKNASLTTWNRARPGTQFAANRVDRDDINWRSYLGADLVDAHLWRLGYTDENFVNIMELLQTQYPSDDLQWLIDYRNEYLKLI